MPLPDIRLLCTHHSIYYDYYEIDGIAAIINVDYPLVYLVFGLAFCCVCVLVLLAAVIAVVLVVTVVVVVL